MSASQLAVLARILMLATLGLIAWSLYRGLGLEALYQFFLGAAVVLLIRRRQEGRAAREQDQDKGH